MVSPGTAFSNCWQPSCWARRLRGVLSPACTSALWQQESTSGFPWYLQVALEPWWTGHPFQLLGTEVALENKVNPSEPL